MLAQHQAIIGRQAADARRLVHNHEHHPLRGLMEPARDEAANLSGMPHLGYDEGPVDFILRSLD
ncbi:MAG TPA: hypothetical protein VFV90_00765 [Usitatibacter sp.]|nr:hypothetical protein [Usitatibacter sp.]